MRSILLLNALLLSPLPAAPATAQSRAPTKIVTAGDLDLTHPRDRLILRRRVNSAVVEVCGDYPRDRMIMPAPVANCRKQAIASAEPQMDALIARRGTQVAIR